MKQIRVRVVGAGSPADPFRVDLPVYAKATDHGDGSWTVEVPDELVTPSGRLSEAYVRRVYRNQPKWDNIGVVARVEVVEDQDAKADDAA